MFPLHSLANSALNCGLSPGQILCRQNGLPSDFELLHKQLPGPTDEERAQGRSWLWGEVEDNSGKKLVSRLQTPDGYTLTAMTALAIVEKVLDGLVAVGFQTPSLVYGADFILEIPGVVREDLD